MNIYHFQIQQTNYFVCANTHFQAEICLAASGVNLDQVDELDDCIQIPEPFWIQYKMPNENSMHPPKSAAVVLGFEQDDTMITFHQYMQQTNIGPHVFLIQPKTQN